jgi:integration host factor subunit alpha
MGLSRLDCASLVEAILDKMSDAIVENGSVKISGFGTFLVREKRARIGRNPKTGEEVMITPRKSLTFRPSNKMRERLS